VDYRQAVEWLQGQSRGQRPRGPERARELLRALGLARPVTRFVHVVGTNGKGSVAAYLEAAFNYAGSGGAFTSPHLVSLRERVRCNGENVPEAMVASYTERVRSLEYASRPAFFDLMLGLALECFQSEGVEWAALEAGVGGASDATMAVDNVAAVVLTNVAADHLRTFGSLEELARDKAMAAQPGRPLITAASGGALELITQIARWREAPLYLYDPDDPLFGLPRQPSLAGSFQRVNAALAAAALRLLGFSEGAVMTGVSQARLPGRLQRLSVRGVDVYLDGAHNPHAAAALAAELPAYHLLFGAHERKEVAATLAPLRQKALSLTFTWPLAASLAGFEATYFADPAEALRAVLVQAARRKEPILVTGSFYLLGRLMSSGLL